MPSRSFGARAFRAFAPAFAAAALFVAVSSPFASAQAPNGALSTTAATAGGAKKALTIDDYTKWKSFDGSAISGDGKWVAYTLRSTNTLPGDAHPAVHILNLESNQDVTITDARSPEFSPDSKWVVYLLDSIPARGGRGGRAGGAGAPPTDSAATPPGAGGRGNVGATATPPKMELRELATGKTEDWEGMSSATFAATSNHVIFRRRPEGGGGRGGRGAGGPPAAAAPTPAPVGGRGTEAIVHDLTTRRSQHLGSVADIAFNQKGDLLAYTVDATVKDGNGLFVMDLASNRTDALENDAKIYGRMTWSDDGNAIAVLKGKEVDKMRFRDNTLTVYRNVRGSAKDPNVKPVTFDPSTASNFPKGWVISDAGLTWSEDNARIFFNAAPQTPTDSARRRSTDSIADVDVWRSQDKRIQSQQMIQANADRNVTYREAFDIASNKYLHMADSALRDVQVSLDGKWAVGRDAREYISDYKRPAADFYRINTATGEKTLMFKGQLTGQNVFGMSPDSKHFVYWKDSKFQDYDLASGATRTLGGTTAPNFSDLDFDHPGPKPPFGVSGYTADGKGVIVQHQYDLWVLPYDGSAPTNLTGGMGTKGEIHYAVARTSAPDENASRAIRSGAMIDLTKPVMLATYGEYTKKSGFAKLTNGKIEDVVYDDASFSTPTRAKNVDTYLFSRQTFAEYPDLRVSGPDFKASKKITNANPQQSEFLWGHRILFDYKNKKGVRLQGILAIPDDYKPGEKRPMIVSFYEKNSQNMHRYVSPSFVTGMGSLPMEAVTKGYLTMFADVYFNTGSSHSDMLECVEAATKKVIELGYADPKHIGINGHSYGGEGASFIGTRSRMFAAVGVGAGVSDLFTDFSQSWGWSYQVSGGSGANGNDYYLYGQGRWGVSPWEKPELYHFESSLTHVPEVTAPFLIMHGTADPTVSFAEGMNLYNALRYNNKNAILLAYPGEGHGLSALANRRDLTVRYFQFFDHYLKDAPAAKWMTDEQPFIKKDLTKGDPK